MLDILGQWFYGWERGQTYNTGGCNIHVALISNDIDFQSNVLEN